MRVLFERLGRRSALAALIALAAAPPQGAAQDLVEVDVELMLMVDVSWSMSPREVEIQRRGYAEALTSDAVVAAIERGPLGRIALSYVEWAGSGTQRVGVAWTLIEGRADAEAFARRLGYAEGFTLPRTSISSAIDYAARSIETNGFDAWRKVVDVSGDGPNNQGRPVTQARDDAVARGLIVNGLPLMTRERVDPRWHIDDLDAYYAACVIGGPGAFSIPVRDWDDFPEAVRRKLVLELAESRPPGDDAGLPLRRVVAEAGYDCLIGERMWRDNFGGWSTP